MTTTANEKNATDESAPQVTEILGDKVCPVSKAPMLDNWLRRWVFSSRKISRTCLKKGDVCLDAGCGPAPMLLDMAKVIGPTGQIICVDIQQEMLDIVERKAREAGLLDQVRLHLSKADVLGIEPEHVNFAIAFWMLHETPDGDDYLRQIAECLKPGGRFLLIEPRFHVSKADVNRLVAYAESLGLKQVQAPRVFMSRTAMFEK